MTTLIILCIIANIIIGRHLNNYMCSKYDFHRSSADLFIWLIIPIIMGGLGIISYIIVAFIEVNSKA
jgi:hypothetical protein